MKISFIDLIRSAFGQKDEKFRQKLYIFLICLAISCIIWFTIKLSDNYDTVVQMPVVYTQVPKGKVLTFASDSILQVEIMERGSNLLRLLYIKRISPVHISLRFLPVYQNGYVYQGIVTPSLLINEIEREQDLLGKIISISPDTIYLSMENEKTRKLPVRADLELTFEKQYMRYGAITFKPDSVVVKGPERIIATMDSASLGKIRLVQLKENFTGTRSFPVDSATRNVIYIPDKISYTIPVEKFTETELEVPVKVINTKDQNVKTFPDKVKVYYTVALKDYSRIEPGMITAVADFSQINPAVDDKIKINIESFPPFIHITQVEPDRVEFIIIK